MQKSAGHSAVSRLALQLAVKHHLTLCPEGARTTFAHNAIEFGLGRLFRVAPTTTVTRPKPPLEVLPYSCRCLGWPPIERQGLVNEPLFPHGHSLASTSAAIEPVANELTPMRERQSVNSHHRDPLRITR